MKGGERGEGGGWGSRERKGAWIEELGRLIKEEEGAGDAQGGRN